MSHAIQTDRQPAFRASPRMLAVLAAVVAAVGAIALPIALDDDSGAASSSSPATKEWSVSHAPRDLSTHRFGIDPQDLRRLHRSGR